jgi:hypothetical protein
LIRIKLAHLKWRSISRRFGKGDVMKQRVQGFTTSCHPFRTTSGRWVLLAPAFLLLGACAPLASILSLGQPAIQSATQFDQFRVVGDGVLLAGSGKSAVDHVASAATGEDCRVVNVLTTEPVCMRACR